jgi:molecular chaperone DnaK
MTITGGSGLSKDEIDRMMKDAEAHAEEDRKRREEAEVRNTAESMQFSTEKFLTENGDKVPADVKSEVDSAVADLKKALEGDDSAAIISATERLGTVSQKLGQAMYADAQAQQATAGGSTGGTPGGASGGDEDVVDAEIVDEPETGEGAA